MIMSRIFKENLGTSTETVELVDLGEKKLRNATEYTSQKFPFVLQFHIVVPHCYNHNKYIANILKAYFKYENNNAKNSTTCFNYIRNDSDEIMVSFSVTSLYTNISIIDKLKVQSCKLDNNKWK